MGKHDGREDRTRYVVCGLSRRAVKMFVNPLLNLGGGHHEYTERAELVGIVDIDLARVEAFKERSGVDVASFEPGDFDEMVGETHPDVVVVASPDWTHAEYIIRALCHGLDVITEKPMVTDCEQVRAVLEAERRSQGTVRVAFNARYQPTHCAMKRLIRRGALGRVTSVEFVHNLDTYHGASYFYRWNRNRLQSGGMSVTKAVHDFDLINWLLADLPEQVFAYGARNYYGSEGAHNPSKRDGVEYHATEQRLRCPYHRHWRSGPGRKEDNFGNWELPYNVQYPDDTPMYLYDEDIDIEDTYSAVVRYRGGASMSYATNFSAPWEGYVLGINGTEGRLETVHFTAPARCPFPTTGRQTITYYPLFGERQIHETGQQQGGHGGADMLLLDDLFLGRAPERSDDLQLAATSEAGAYAVAVGEAVWRSVQENRAINIEELLGQHSG